MTLPPDQNPDTHDDSDLLRARMQHMADEQFYRQMRQASALLTQGQGQAAIPLLERCYALRPEDIDVLTNLGGAYIMIGRHLQAIPLLERASELAPDNPSVWLNLAAAYLGRNLLATRERQDKALAAYRRVIAIDAAFPNVHYNMGLVYLDRREWDSAYDAFSQALRTNPADRDAQRLRDEIALRRNQPPAHNNN